jgi:hypothetical protein
MRSSVQFWPKANFFLLFHSFASPVALSFVRLRKNTQHLLFIVVTRFIKFKKPVRLKCDSSTVLLFGIFESRYDDPPLSNFMLLSYDFAIILFSSMPFNAVLTVHSTLEGGTVYTD